LPTASTRTVGDPTFGQVEAETQTKAIEKAWKAKEIARRRLGTWAGCGLIGRRRKSLPPEMSQ
jgi:hypothetical protein